MDAEDALGPAWPRLRAFCDERIELHARSIPDPATVLSFELGLYFRDPGDHEWTPYAATPEDSFTFAHTGVDGDHFSVLLPPDALGVVVLTAPMAFDNPNVVVAESVREFLELGCVSGYSAIAELAMIDRPRAVEALATPVVDASAWSGARPADCLAELRQRLGLTPWKEIPRRLATLHDAYARFIVANGSGRRDA